MDIVATGMACAVGLTAATACAALRAKVAGFADLPYVDNDAETIVGAAVPGLDPALNRRGRLVELLATALSDCLNSESVPTTRSVPLLVGLASPDRPGGSAGSVDAIIPDVEARLGRRFDPVRSAAIPNGHTSGFEALRRARTLLREPSVPACLVCGVDSYINAPSLLWLERYARLKTPANSDGVIPGEAAACVLVVRAESEPRLGCVARVVGLGFAHEAASVMTEEPLRGLGLAAAGRAALDEAGVSAQDVDWRFSDLGGESYSFREQILLLCRLLKEPRECTPLWHNAESIGETGAAAGVAELVVIHQAFRKRYAPGARVLCATSDDGGGRAVAIVERRVAGKTLENGPGAGPQARRGIKGG